MFNRPTPLPSNITVRKRAKKTTSITADAFEVMLQAFIAEKQPETTKNGKKLNLGDGLLVHVKKNNKIYFQLRYCLGSKNTTKQIGPYPKMSFKEAREYADNYQAKFAETRTRNSEKAFTQRLKDMTEIGKVPCFNGFEKARAFISALAEAIKTTTDIEKKEMLLAIWLQLLMPDLGRKILKSQYYMPYPDIQTIEFSFNDLSTSHSILTPEIKKTLDTLSSLNPESKEGLFPSLYRQSDLEIKKRLQNLINEFWSGPRINTDQFKAFFSYAAHQHGGFNAKFIKLIISGKDIEDQGYYSHQKRALRLWWCEQINRRDDKNESMAFLTLKDISKKNKKKNNTI